MLAAAVNYTLRLEGDLIECGSYRGGSAAVVAQLLKDTGKVVHLCDSFQGLPEPCEKDNYHGKGSFGDTSAADVRQGFEELGVAVKIHEGWFSETLRGLQHLRFCTAHIDVDLYESVRECLEFCYPRMTPGGIMIVDDYGDPRCLGVKAACDEFLRAVPEKLVQLSRPSVGILVGTRNEESLFDILRRRAGWIGAFPVVGRGLYRRW
jgi:O-methyltransferase